MRISDWSSDVCSSDLQKGLEAGNSRFRWPCHSYRRWRTNLAAGQQSDASTGEQLFRYIPARLRPDAARSTFRPRSEEHTSELQSLMRISYAVFCLKKKTYIYDHTNNHMTLRSYSSHIL